MPSRRNVVGSAALLTGLLASQRPTAAKANTAQAGDIDVASCFDGLPGDIAFKIVAPATDTAPRFFAARNSSQRLFVGSAIKTFALAQALIEADSPNVVTTLQQQNLTLDASVWNQDSQSFNPPNLSGIVSERTTLEAMIMHSDNTATDMIFNLLGPTKIRSFIQSAGLQSTQVPDSTRSFFGYLLNAPDFRNFTWAELQASADKPIVNSPLNDTETLASSCDDFVSYYSRALQGRFFKDPATLNEFQRILSLADAIYIVPFPLGGSVFLKGGSIDVPGFHCVCLPGGMFYNNRWIYFSFVINWYAEATQDPATVALFLSALKQAIDLVVTKLSAT